MLTVATPVLAGQVVDQIVNDGSSSARSCGWRSRSRWSPSVQAVISIGERWQSARIGEGLILDLRRTVFTHVQRMPVAFFMRTRTGALVSRLNNDVIGAQRAFTWTLSGVVSNVISLVLALAVMLRLSWQITLLALVLLPIFVIPARRMGARLAQLEREGAGAQRGDDDPDDRALLGARGDAGQAVRPSRSRRPTSSAPVPTGWRRSACARRWASTCS